MASIYRRPPGSRDGIFWIAFYHPQTGDLIRRSLDTADRTRAERIRANMAKAAARVGRVTISSFMVALDDVGTLDL